MTWLISIAALLVIAVIVAQLDRRSPPDDAPMGRRSRLLLMFYLLGLAGLMVYSLIKLSALDYPDVPLTVVAPADPDATALSKLPGPALFYAMPHLTPGSPTTYELALYGSKFQKDAKVRLNGHEHVPKSVNADNFIRVVPENKVLIGTNALVAEVVNPDGGRSNALTLRLDRPKMTTYLLGSPWSITRELQLILLVVCAGALGALIHGVSSLVDYIGNRAAVSSWFWWYVTRPFVGSAMAVIFYAVLRGGLTGTSADVRVVNPFGAIAVAALVGMYSTQAALKLREIFDTLFKPRDEREDKISETQVKSDDKRGSRVEPTIDKLVPPTVRPGTGKPIEVTIVGDRLSRTTAVKVNGADRKPEKIDEKEIVLKLTPDDTRNIGELKIGVITPRGTSDAATLWVSNLDITTAALPPGKVGADYTGQLAAAGGTELKWSMDNAPDGLKIDTASGAVSGKPTRPGSTKTTVTAIDKAGASASREYDIQIAP